MKKLVLIFLFWDIFTDRGYAQQCLDLTTRYEHSFQTFNYSVIITESCDSNHHCLVLKNLLSGRLDTVGNSLSPGTAPNNIAYFGFIDSSHFVLIVEQSHYPYRAKYYLIAIKSNGLEQTFSETIIFNPTASIGLDQKMSRKGRYNYEVISPTHIKILDRGKPVALLHFDLEQKKLIKTEIKTTKKVKKRG
ncbi:MAG: hypothetical protein J0L99_09150 [Chitinophagales bacterium]|nr:hypothetical protein [Chitinophagales bacterium]